MEIIYKLIASTAPNTNVPFEIDEKLWNDLLEKVTNSLQAEYGFIISFHASYGQ